MPAQTASSHNFIEISENKDGYKTLAFRAFSLLKLKWYHIYILCLGSLVENFCLPLTNQKIFFKGSQNMYLLPILLIIQICIVAILQHFLKFWEKNPIGQDCIDQNSLIKNLKWNRMQSRQYYRIYFIPCSFMAFEQLNLASSVNMYIEAEFLTFTTPLHLDYVTKVGFRLVGCHFLHSSFELQYSVDHPLLLLAFSILYIYISQLALKCSKTCSLQEDASQIQLQWGRCGNQ